MKIFLLLLFFPTVFSCAFSSYPLNFPINPAFYFFTRSYDIKAITGELPNLNLSEFTAVSNQYALVKREYSLIVTFVLNNVEVTLPLAEVRLYYGGNHYRDGKRADFEIEFVFIKEKYEIRTVLLLVGSSELNIDLNFITILGIGQSDAVQSKDTIFDLFVISYVENKFDRESCVDGHIFVTNKSYQISVSQNEQLRNRLVELGLTMSPINVVSNEASVTKVYSRQMFNLGTYLINLTGCAEKLAGAFVSLVLLLIL